MTVTPRPGYMSHGLMKNPNFDEQFQDLHIHSNLTSLIKDPGARICRKTNVRNAVNSG